MNNNKFSKKIINKTISLYKDKKKNLSTEDIAKRLNVSYPWVIKTLHKYKIPLKPQKFIRKYSLNEKFFENIDSWEKAYVLGFIMSDGNISKYGYSISIQLNSKDINILNRINSDKKIVSGIRDGRNFSILRINSKKLWNDIQKYNITPNKSLTLKFPNNIKKKYYNALILGIFDGDGCFTKNGNIIIAGSKDVCDSIHNIAKNIIGLKYSYVRNHSTRIFAFNVCRQNECEKFCDWMYKSYKACLIRKRDAFIKFFKNKKRNKKIQKQEYILNLYENPKKIIELYTKDKKSLIFIGEKYNVCPSTIKRILEKNNVNTFKRIVIKEYNKYEKEILNLYVKNYKSLTHIANKLNISISVVRRILNKNKIQIRKNSEQYKIDCINS
jgi:transposase